MILLVSLFSAALCLLLHLLLRRRRRPSPLALPPGPYGFPVIGSLPQFGPKIHEDIATLSKRYGPLMYLKMGSQGTVIASSPAAARAFLTTAEANFANRPSVQSAAEMTYGGQDIVFSRYGPRWKLLRKLCVMHMVGGRPLADLAPIRRDEVGVLLRSLHGSSSVVVRDAITSAVGNIMGRVVLSRRLFDEPEFMDTMRDLETDGDLFGAVDFTPVLAWLDPLLQRILKGVRRKHKRFDAMITQMLAEHAASAHNREGQPDFIDLVMQNLTGSDGETLSDANVKGLILDLLTAGTDPSTVVIEWALAEMVSNPEIMKRVQSEMDQVIGGGKDRRLEESDLPSLPYLQAVCKEALRKHPPLPLSLPRCSSEPCEVEGYYIPANTQLMVNVWAMGRNPDLWDEPLEFRPERFLSDDTSVCGSGADKDFLLMPFGAGRRGCVGKPAGLLVVQYILGSLLHSFEWRLPEGEEVDMEEEFTISLTKAVPLKVVLSPRLSPAAYM